MIEVHEIPVGAPLQPGAAGVDGMYWPVLNNIVRQAVNSLREQGLLNVPLFRFAAYMEAGPNPVREPPFETIVRQVVVELRQEGYAQASQPQPQAQDPQVLQHGLGGGRPLPMVNDIVQRVVHSLRLMGQQGTAPFMQGN